MKTDPELAPEFADLRDRLKRVQWLSNVGHPISTGLPFPCRRVEVASAAREAIALPEWEGWTLERANDLTSFLDQRFQHRYAGQWNKIARIAKSLLLEEIQPLYLPALERAMPGSKVLVEAVQWDLLHALMEAAYSDLHPPRFFARLIAVYESGHLPVGWDSIDAPGRLLVY